jgi:hypothetical protein
MLGYRYRLRFHAHNILRISGLWMQPHMLSKSSASVGNIGNLATKVKVKTDTLHPTLENVGFRVGLEAITPAHIPL